MTEEKKTEKSEPKPLIKRVRHEFKSRLVRVIAKEMVSENMLRVTVGDGDSLEGFTSLGFDDHFKLLIPHPNQDKPNLPKLVDEKIIIEEPKPIMRDYTPLFWNDDNLTFDAFIHDGGIASDWLKNANLGDYLGIAGPRGSFVISKKLDWYWFFADSSSLPAVERRLLELSPPKDQIKVFVHLEKEKDKRELKTLAKVQFEWLITSNMFALDSFNLAIEKLSIPKTPCKRGFVWAAGESSLMKNLRPLLIRKGLNSQNMKIASYWKAGSAGSEHKNLTEGFIGK